MAIESFSSYHNRIKRFNPHAKSIIYSQWLRHFGSGISHAIFNIFLITIGYSKTFLGGFVAISAVTIATTSIVFAISAHRIGSERGILLGYGFDLFASILKTFFPEPNILIIGGIIGGIGFTLQTVALAPFLAEHSNELERTYLFGVNQAVGISGRFLGSILAGFLPGWISIGFSLPYEGGQAFQLALLLWIVPTGLSFIPIFRHNKRKKIVQLSRKPIDLSLLTTEDVKRDSINSSKIIIQFGVISVLLGVGAGFVLPYMNIFFWEFYSLPTPLVGLITGSAQIASVGGVLLSPLFAGRLGSYRVILVLRGISIPFLFLLGIVIHPSIAIVCYLCRTAFMDGADPIAQSLQMAMVPEKKRPHMSAMQTGTLNLSLGLGAQVTGPLYDQGIYLISFSYTTICYLLSILAFVILFRRNRWDASNQNVPST